MGLTLEPFVNLQALSLHGITSIDDIEHLLTSPLIYLAHLTIDQCGNHEEHNDRISLIDRIWQLPRLTHCHINGQFLSYVSIIKLSNSSSSIRYLHMNGYCFSLEELIHMLNHTAMLRQLHVTIGNIGEEEISPIMTTSLKSFNIMLLSPPIVLHSILQCMTSLRSLSIQTKYFLWHGDKWQQLIAHHLPNITVFRLHMSEFNLNESIYNIDSFVDNLLETFRTPFWLSERQWFVRCEWRNEDISRMKNICLYTLPFWLDTSYVVSYQMKSKSTCHDQYEKYSFTLVHSVSLLNDERCVESLFPYQFINVRSLKLSLPIDPYFRSILPNLTYLTSLSVSTNGCKLSTIQLETMINTAPYLYSLTVDEHTALQLGKLKLTTNSIRRVHCLASAGTFAAYFDTRECSTFIHSTLGHQCEVFFVKVAHRSNIIELVNGISHLRSLICRCKQDRYRSHWSSPRGNDELIEWLQDQVSSNCSISRDPWFFQQLRFWIT
jgi:hypothetical protein